MDPPPRFVEISDDEEGKDEREGEEVVEINPAYAVTAAAWGQLLRTDVQHKTKAAVTSKKRVVAKGQCAVGKIKCFLVSFII
jgi:hypothetical protein